MSRHCLKLIHCVVIAALFAGSGAQWFMLQSVAWTGMLIRFSQQTTFTEAVEKTFDGQHPCPLCSHIANAETQPAIPDAAAPAWESIKGILCHGPAIFRPAWTSVSYPPFISWGPARSALPLTPPPRLAALA